MMQREIKFRVWDGERMHAPSNVRQIMCRGDGVIWFARVYDPATEDLCILDCNACRFLQFTGLYDAGGQEIYEGDVIEVFVGDPLRAMRTSVIWYGEQTRWAPYPAPRMAGLWEDIWEWTYGRIIGNVHENPDLIPRR